VTDNQVLSHFRHEANFIDRHWGIPILFFWQLCINLSFAKEVQYGELFGGAFDSAKNHKRQRRKRQSVTA